jgi:hypothetical protein
VIKQREEKHPAVTLPTSDLVALSSVADKKFIIYPDHHNMRTGLTEERGGLEKLYSKRWYKDISYSVTNFYLLTGSRI